MSQVKIALQPPPNVDFVVGYPGIPPGARDRPQAAVKGAVEVRVTGQEVKAKWIRIELKKVEMLPGGGQTNSYFDFVGQSPMTLWQSSEEYESLKPQDIPFEIRIPESIPPSIALEKGAGIRYELVATVCTLGKKGFFRRRKIIVTSAATTIIIDKHELHSTWPIYSQPELRSVNQDGVHLTVERQRTCFGPGDRVSVMAILKSDSVHPVVLRGFEFTLQETTIFRAGPQPGSTGKRSGPLVKVGPIGEQKVPLSVTLFAGMQHKAEVGCLIPNTHTTTTLNTARHIDITYTIVVKAWFGSMQSATMDLPVIISNWPRSVSEEAIRRIGTAPTLCMVTPSSTATTVPVPTRPLTGNSQTSDYSSSAQGQGRTPFTPPATSIQYNSAPSAQNGSGLEVDEVGALQGPPSRVQGTIDHPGYGSPQPSMGSIKENGVSSTRPVATARRRRGSATAAATQNRLTITNISDLDAEVREAVEQEQLATRLAQPTTPPPKSQRPWLSAEDEKKRLYETARAKVEKVQGSAVMTPQTGEASSPLKSSPSARAAWPSAEEEKVRLFDKAQATAKRTQALGSYSGHSRETSEANGASGITQSPRSTNAISAGAALYQHAVSTMNKGPTTKASFTAGSISPPRSPDPPSPPASSSSKTVPHYPSAEDEKAALKRYHEAKLAVDRTQNSQYASREGIPSSSAPVAYDTLYPSTSISRSVSHGAPDQAGGSDMPPPFDGPNDQPQYLTEKERLRRRYEAQDAAAVAAQSSMAPLDESPSYTASYVAPGQSSVTSALSEKELLRRRYEEQDAAALAQQPHPVPPPRAVNGSRLPPPVPPSGSGFRPLTAAEEKAQLRAKYAAEEQQANDNAASASASAFGSTSPSPPGVEPSPPPLMPRPPAEYIQETQEEDARVRFFDTITSTGIENSLVHGGSPLVRSGTGIQLDIRPFTPFMYDPTSGSPGAQRPPPRPPFPQN